MITGTLSLDVKLNDLFTTATSRKVIVSQPRSQGTISSSLEKSTLVAAGHVSMYTNQIRTGGGSLT